MGFGLSFYGFFLFAAFWVCAYFLWAFYYNGRERRISQSPGSPAPRRGEPRC
jgi:hypothetical protein